MTIATAARSAALPADRPETAPDAVPEGLCAALARAGLGDRSATCVLLPGHGLMHRHVRIGPVEGVLALARLPRSPLPGLDAAASLARQAEAFRALAPSERVPRLLGMLPPRAALPSASPGALSGAPPDALPGSLPCGGLIVEEIAGRPPRLPEDLPALAEALARIHALPPALPACLREPGGHLAATLARIDRHLATLPAEAAPAVRAALREARDAADGFAAEVAARPERLPLAPILVDAHPGNFRIREDGIAIAVDLEKAALGPPGVDLAHLTLASSADWDPDCAGTVGAAALRRFHTAHCEHLAAAGWSDGTLAALAASLAPLRRLVWLRTTAFCAAYLAGQIGTSTLAGGKSSATDPLIRHFQARAARALSPEFVAAMVAALAKEAASGPA